MDYGTLPRIRSASSDDLTFTHVDDLYDTTHRLEFLAKTFKTDLKNGLRGHDIEQRRSFYGTNDVSTSPHGLPLVWQLFRERIRFSFDPSLWMLFWFSALWIGLGCYYQIPDWGMGVALVLCLFIALIFDGFLEYLRKLYTKDLRASQTEEKMANVIRSGQRQPIPFTDVIVGDVVILLTGDEVPCDGRFISFYGAAHEIEVDESSMTGSADPSHKTLENPLFYRGSYIVRGSATFLCTRVGTETNFGQMMEMFEEEEDVTPNEDALNDLTRDCSNWTTFPAVLAVIGHVSWYVFNYAIHPRDIVACLGDLNTTTWEGMTMMEPLGNSSNGTMWCSTGEPVPGMPGFVFVAGTFEPESLWIMGRALLVFFALQFASPSLHYLCTLFSGYFRSQMKKKQITEQRKIGLENMSEITDLCIHDVCITEGQLFVSEIQLGKKHFKIEKPNKQHQENKKFFGTEDLMNPEALETLMEACVLSLQEAELETTSGKTTFIGEKIECGLLFFAQNFISETGDYRRLQKAHPPISTWKWDHTMGLSSIFVKRKKTNFYRLYFKGEAEPTLNSCSYVLDPETGTIKKMDSEFRKQRIEDMDKMALNGQRLIGLAYRDYRTLEDCEENDEAFLDSTWIGVLGLFDPVREGVPEAIKCFRDSGVTCRYYTSRSQLIGQRIAKNAGIWTKEKVPSSYTPNKPDSELSEHLQDLIFLPRAQPADIFRLVALVEESGLSCAATGDGCGDGPILRKSHVGLSMGVSGTTISHDSSDAIIEDDKIETILEFYRWAHAWRNNLRRTSGLMLQNHFCLCFIVLMAALCGYGTPINPFQIIWIGFISSFLVPSAFMIEGPHPSDKIHQDKTSSRRSPLPISTTVNFTLQAIVQVFLLCFLLFAFSPDGTLSPGVSSGAIPYGQVIPNIHSTIIFNSFVCILIGNMLWTKTTLRSPRHLIKQLFSADRENGIFWIVLMVIMAVQGLLVQFGSVPIGCEPLAWKEWALCIGVGMITLLFGLFVSSINPNINCRRNES